MKLTLTISFQIRFAKAALNIGQTKGRSILAFCNSADSVKRDNLTLRIIYDEGKTWTINKVIAKSPEGYKGDLSAYSDLVKLSDATVGVLYEKDNYKQIVFQEIVWKNNKP